VTPGLFFTGLGYLVGGLVFLWAARAKRLSTDGVWVIVAVGVFCGVVGARVTELIAEGWPGRLPAGVLLNPSTGGRSLLGGLVFGWLGVLFAKKQLGLRRPLGDLFALALPAGEAVGRIGCYFNGCCYGEASNVSWAVWQHGAWRHPAQLYSAVVAAALLGFLLWLRPRLTREGELFRVYLLGFGVSRFLIEFVRWRETLVLGLSPMQWFCLELAASVVVAAVWRWSRTGAAVGRATESA
jgi:phosphatidylglycerol:prolipoprotein diacylglycerol transferase